MFSGIVEEIGIVMDVVQRADLIMWDGSRSQGFTITIKCSKALEGAYIGCSIAVNGVCLTVTDIQRNGAPGSGTFQVNIAPETLRKTNLGHTKVGDGVNLERALRVGDRNSGHNVQGHIDGKGTIIKFQREQDSLWVTVRVSEEILRYVVPKGFVAVDGTSLTVCDVNRVDGWFNFMLVPHTQKNVVIPRRAVGDAVNIEVDVMGKYLDRSLGDVVDRVTKLEKSVAALQEQRDGLGSGAIVASAPREPVDVELSAIRSHAKSRSATKHGVGLVVPLPDRAEAATLRVGIVSASWHAELIGLMRSKVRDRLVELGVPATNILDAVAPGSYELPFLASQMIREKEVDAVVCIGILLKGGTIHMEVLAGATTQSMLDLSLQSGVPVVFGVLTVLKIEQAVERAESDLPKSWADSAACMAMHKRSLRLAKL